MNFRFNYYMILKVTFLLAIILSVSFFQCKQDAKSKEFVLKIRLADEPDCLNPIVSQSGYATQIEALIMPPLFEYGVEDMEFSPILLKELNEPIVLNDSTLMYDYEILSKAVWEDGQPVTGTDVVYTIKSSLNPNLKNKTYIGFFKNIRDARSDSADPKKIRIMVNRLYMLNREMSGNYSIYPEHIYDPGKTLRNFSIPDLLFKDSSLWGEQNWNLLKSFALRLQSTEFCKNGIIGCGPYKLESWQTGSKIVLKKVKNWWGDQLSKDYPLLKAYPDKIEYWIMPDESSALLELEKGNIDLMSDISPRLFIDLKSKSNASLSFSTPLLMQYNYIEINHRNKILKDLVIREALSSLIDIKTYITQQYMDLADPVTSPVHPSRKYFNKELKPINFNPEHSNQILKDNGWTDTDKDGILDKFINGKKEKLEFRLLVANRETSKKLALLIQEESRKAGIHLIVEPKEGASLIADLNALNFDLALVAQRQSPSLWDPYQSWSSSNVLPGGFNKSGYTTPILDSMIESIRNSKDDYARNSSYQILQKELHDQVAQIFLFAPKERIAYSNKLNVVTSSRRPGYYEAWINRK
ncbi:MAG: hypothetical protein IT267_01565 [Saprospiraceae bacterium]|nr:hypothetical protein [Saprospiraceae bacterium]